jgi:hypothetical protein
MRLTASTGFALAVLAFVAAGASAAAPQILSVGFSKVGTETATLEASVNPGGKLTHYRFEYGLSDCASGACTSTEEKDLPGGGSPVPVEEVTVGGLTPSTVYHFRLVAKNGVTPADRTVSSDRVFATYPAPLVGLPDNRAYEQASPVDKDGGDAIGTVPQLKASPKGNAITFSSTFGIPGGTGAQEFPLYLASRSASGWTTEGLLPPPNAGQVAVVAGWLPDFSKVFASTIRLGSPDTGALVARPGGGGALQELTPYLPKANYSFIGSAGDGKEVIFESSASLGSSPAGAEGVQNVYAWNREGGEVLLVSVGNDKQPMVKGAFGGSYDWALGSSPTNLSHGGAARNYYTQDEHAVASSGSIFFTEAGSGQLFMRVNPMQAQSKLNGEGKCEEPEMACTIHISESQRTPPDPAGPRPAAFMGATEDGSSAFFTSPEKLTDDATTGPEQPKPKIGRVGIDGVSELDPNFLEEHRAVGVAVDSKFIYWADPADGTIGRAELDGSKPEDEFIVPKPVTVEEEIEIGPEEFEIIEEKVPSRPNYLAVDAGHIYWTNTADGDNGHGTIGRADIGGTEASEKPECIKGASNPQGIAVNATNIYWANSGSAGLTRRIGRAGIDCEGAVQNFQRMKFESAEAPYGVALSVSKLYWVSEGDGGGASINRVPLAGGPNFEDIETFSLSNTAKPRGLAAAGDNLYWAARGGEAIGHAVWLDASKSPTTPEEEFIKLNGGPSGIAIDAKYIYWSTDGETLPSPGNDLYRFDSDGNGGGSLSDLTPDPTTENGAEVQGVVAISKDGTRVYFTANADLDGSGEGKAGNCVSPLRLAEGQCNLYLWSQGEGVKLIARLNADGNSLLSDAINWAPTTTGVSSGSAFQKTAFSSDDGKTLLFRSQEQLSGFSNKGVPELYRYREGQPIACVSCNPTGESSSSFTLGSLKPSALRAAEPASLASRNLSADGNRAFFETADALVSSDTNGLDGCPPVGATLQAFAACRDVYEWEAPGSGSCTESPPSYSPANGGCLYLISTGKDDYPSFFADASTNGNDVFFFTRQGLVGQDKDELLDVYDAKVGGGIAAQNSLPAVTCESTEACHGPVPAPPSEGSPTSQAFVGPGNVVSKPKPHKKPKPKKHKVKKKQKHHKQRQGNAERRAER